MSSMQNFISKNAASAASRSLSSNQDRNRKSGAALSTSIISRYFEASLYLMIFTAVATVVSTGRLDLPSTIVAPVLLIIKGIRRWRGRSPELSHTVATWLVVAAFALMPLDYFTWSHARAATAPNPALYAALLSALHFLLLAILLRLYSASSRRDHLFLAMLGFAAMLASAVLTVDTAFFALFLVFVVLGISTTISLELERASEGAISAPLDPASPAARHMIRALSTTSFSVALGTIVLGSVIFFLLPRFTGGYFSSYSVRPTLMTGFSETVELGQIGEIKKSSAVVMRVKIEGEPSRFAGTHWRGVALTNFDGWRWSAASGPHARIYPQTDGWFPLGSEDRRATRELKYAVLLEPVASDAIFVAADVTAIRGRFATASGLSDSARRNYLLADRTRSLFTPYPNYSESRYEAISSAPVLDPAALRAAATIYPHEIRAQYLGIPVLDTRIAALAQQITAAAPTPYDKAFAIESYLRSHFGYTLELTSTPVKDPLASFLFQRRAGNCEYFASAMTVMLRTLGIPARYINGFQTGEYNDVGGDYIVRASDAHSWVEAYFPGSGRIEFDPTPAGGPEQTHWYSAFSKYYDWFQLQWGDWVVNYDFVHQIALAQGVQRTSREWFASVRDRFTRMHDSLTERMRGWQAHASSSPLTSPLLIIFLTGSVAFALWVAAAKGRFSRLTAVWTLRVARSRELTPRLASLHYSEMLRILERRGFRKPASATPLEFAASISQPEIAAPIGRMTNLYQSARFGSAEADSRAAASLVAEIRALLSKFRSRK
jgi:transglutaminase-like putative cysteine protease